MSAPAGSMGEVAALEKEIMAALPRADAAAEHDPSIRPTLAFAHDILCNGWTEPGSRLDRLRTIAAAMRRIP